MFKPSLPYYLATWGASTQAVYTVTCSIITLLVIWPNCQEIVAFSSLGETLAESFLCAPVDCEVQHSFVL